MQAPLAVLSDNSRQSKALIAALSQEFRVAALVVEHSSLRRKLKLLFRRIRRLGLGHVVAQLAFMIYDRLFVRRRSAGTIEPLLAKFGSMPKDIPIHLVNSINEPKVRELLQTLRISVCVVTGTSLLSRELLESGPVFLNIHCGITPTYRGVHGGFWAICQEDWDNVGVTIHRIDAGIDTGQVLAQSRIDIDLEYEDTQTLVAKQYSTGIPLLIDTIRGPLHGPFRQSREKSLPSRLWSSPTIADHRQLLRNLQARKLMIQSRETTEKTFDSSH
jgi:phosphoribosylglycinamide formyltransferase-1